MIEEKPAINASIASSPTPLLGGSIRICEKLKALISTLFKRKNSRSKRNALIVSAPLKRTLVILLMPFSAAFCAMCALAFFTTSVTSTLSKHSAKAIEKFPSPP